MHSQKKVIVAMSGGVDSSVAAALLKDLPAGRQGGGFDVRGVHIKMWSDPSIPCTTKEDRFDAMKVAAKLSIPFETWDFTKDYKQGVVDYMIREYAAGRTPNPDVMCNKKIKFGVFLKRALEAGADYIATGHYVRKSFLPITNKTRITNIRNSETFVIRRKTHKLYTAKDQNKDQSYFLWTLNQSQLQRCLFPIGDYTKPEVRELARKYALPTADKKDSQGLCFIGKIDVREFLKNYIPEKRGRVLTTSGKRVGEHAGLEFLTIGQRHGLGISGRPREVGEPRPKGAGGTPYYVVEKDFATNTLVVTKGADDYRLARCALIARELNWTSGETPELPMKCEARIRYRSPLKDCLVKSTNREEIEVLFDEPQRAVTPGQSIVFYTKELMLGGGVIR